MNLIIKIQDNGEGISDEGIKKLFIKFNRLEENQGINKEGTGLGLSICKQLVE
jgi:signal transduction histidine kinase